ncbi:hypothetical protein BGW80DRAFT_1249963 [Lactifluus volemus]|nr:hypothetical protein BGW80DRAFT_1249963 [Lactifluus volemus]
MLPPSTVLAWLMSQQHPAAASRIMFTHWPHSLHQPHSPRHKHSSHRQQHLANCDFDSQPRFDTPPFKQDSRDTPQQYCDHTELVLKVYCLLDAIRVKKAPPAPTMDLVSTEKSARNSDAPTGSTLGLNANGHSKAGRRDDVSANGSDQPSTRPAPPLAHDAIPSLMLFTADHWQRHHGTTLPSSEGSTLTTATSGRRPFHRSTIPTPFESSMMPIAVHGAGIDNHHQTIPVMLARRSLYKLELAFRVITQSAPSQSAPTIDGSLRAKETYRVLFEMIHKYSIGTRDVGRVKSTVKSVAHCLAKAAYTGALAATLIGGRTVGKRTEQLEVLTLSSGGQGKMGEIRRCQFPPVAESKRVLLSRPTDLAFTQWRLRILGSELNHLVRVPRCKHLKNAPTMDLKVPIGDDDS